jgi:hypothetical protein
VQFSGVSILHIPTVVPPVSLTQHQHSFMLAVMIINNISPPNQTNSSKVISSIECSGNETKLADCHIELANTSDVECASLSAVGCGR